MKHRTKTYGKRVTALLHWAERQNARFWTALAKVAEAGADARGLKNRILRTLRVLVLAVLSFNVNEVPMRSAALVFTTLLAFIPFTIILSSVVGWLGYLDLLRTLIPYMLDSLNLDLNLDPLMRGIETAEAIGFSQLGLWGSLGLLVGFYLSMSSIEEAMNRVWNVRTSRGWIGRFARYTPFLLLLFLTLVLAVFLLIRVRVFLEYWGFAGSFSFHIPGGAILFGSLGFMAFLWVLMVLMIRLLPNTRVRFPAALVGAVAGIVPLYLFSRFLLIFPKLFLERNQVFYGSLAIFPVALLLLYLFWICVLFGSAVAFVHERLRDDTDHSFFVRGAGLMEDWDAAMRDTEDLYRGSGRPKPGERTARVEGTEATEAEAKEKKDGET